KNAFAFLISQTPRLLRVVEPWKGRFFYCSHCLRIKKAPVHKGNPIVPRKPLLQEGWPFLSIHLVFLSLGRSVFAFSAAKNKICFSLISFPLVKNLSAPGPAHPVQPGSVPLSIHIPVMQLTQE